MMECCNTCKRKMRLEKLDYSQGGCKHTDMEGFACLALASEGVISWMVGLRGDGMCEEYVPMEEQP